MPTYFVQVREVHVTTTEIEAESPQDAAHKVVRDGEGDEVIFEFSHYLDVKTYTVEDSAGVLTECAVD